MNEARAPLLPAGLVGSRVKRTVHVTRPASGIPLFSPPAGSSWNLAVNAMTATLDKVTANISRLGASVIHQGGHVVLYMKLSEPFLIIAFMEGLLCAGIVPILHELYHMALVCSGIEHDYPCSTDEKAQVQ